jgi:hypothetical protein
MFETRVVCGASSFLSRGFSVIARKLRFSRDFLVLLHQGKRTINKLNFNIQGRQKKWKIEVMSLIKCGLGNVNLFALGSSISSKRATRNSKLALNTINSEI